MGRAEHGHRAGPPSRRLTPDRGPRGSTSGRRRITDDRLGGDSWRLWSAAVVSRLGGGAAGSALPLLAATITGHPRQIALVGVFAGLPWLLLALHTGALADRWDRRRTTWLCDLVSAATMTALAVGVLSGAAPLAAPCAAAFAAATVGTLFDSASQAALPSLVARDRLSTAQLAPSAYGSVLTGVAVGGVLGASLAPRLERRVGTGTVVLATVALTVAADVGLALTRSGPVAGVLLGGVGFAAFAFDVVSVSYRQSVVPDHLQGRVSSAHRVATWGIDPVGAAAAGVVAAGVGLPAVFRGAAVVLALAGLATARHLTTARLAAGLLA